MKLKNISFAVLILMLAAFSGCAKKADPNRPVDQIKKDVETMSVAQLQDMAGAYAAAVKAQKAELIKITDAMKGMPVQEIFSDKAKSIKNRLAKINSESAALLERYQIYFNKLTEEGGDLSKVRLD